VIVGLGAWAAPRFGPSPGCRLLLLSRLFVQWPPPPPPMPALSRQPGTGSSPLLSGCCTSGRPGLYQRTQALEALVSPRPVIVQSIACGPASMGHWRGRLEGLAYDELVNRFGAGSRGLSRISARAKLLLAKQMCHRLGQVGCTFGLLPLPLAAGQNMAANPPPHEGAGKPWFSSCLVWLFCLCRLYLWSRRQPFTESLCPHPPPKIEATP
jgi:hypothetical protein